MYQGLHLSLRGLQVDFAIFYNYTMFSHSFLSGRPGGPLKRGQKNSGKAEGKRDE